MLEKILFLIALGLSLTFAILFGLANASLERTRETYYRLGRGAGANAILNLDKRHLETGREYTLEEAYHWADSVANVDFK